MAIFKSVRTKSKNYVFKYEGNEKLKEPARAIFARFPYQDEHFIKRGDDIHYGDIDFKKIGKKDLKEIEKLLMAFLNSYLNDTLNNVSAQFNKVDREAFLRECVEQFENLYAEDESGNKKAIKTIDDFLTLPVEAVYEITKDLYTYANIRDKFTMGE
jgi:hypothetical protein